MRSVSVFQCGIVWLVFSVTSCVANDERVMEVTATAYNSLEGQTSGSPTLAAWGDVLEPGMKVIAVSRDLIPLGLGHNTRVRIDGLPGEYRVLDKLVKRWTRRIDIYLGEDVQAARNWGKQQVTIRWEVKAD